MAPPRKRAYLGANPQKRNVMRECYDNERIDIEPDEDYFDRSGCGPIAAALAIIALFLLVVGGICLFT